METECKLITTMQVVGRRAVADLEALGKEAEITIICGGKWKRQMILHRMRETKQKVGFADV